MTNEPQQQEEPTSLEDMRREAEAALGPPPDPSRWRGDPADDALLTEGNPANLTDGQTAPGFEPEAPPPAAEFAALQTRADGPDGTERTAAQMADAEQASYLPPDVPDGHLAPPLADAIANETWHVAGEQFAAIVRDVLDFDEFAHLEEFTHMTIWHRQGKPKHPWADLDGERSPMLAKVRIVPPDWRWVVGERESPDALPHFVVALYYQHFHDLREEGMFYHRDEIAKHVHLALSVLSSDSGILSVMPPSVVVHRMETLERYGLYSQGLRRLQRPMLPLMETDVLQTPGYDVGPGT